MRLRSPPLHLSIAVVSILALVSGSRAQTLTPGTDSKTETLTSGVGSKGETLTYGADLGVAESDNVTLVSTNKVSQTMALADADFDYKKISRRLDVDA